MSISVKIGVGGWVFYSLCYRVALFIVHQKFTHVVQRNPKDNNVYL